MILSAAQKKKQLRYLAKQDERYCEIEREFKRLEAAFMELAGSLTDQQQDTVWEFVCMSNELDMRLLDIACTCMEFREEYQTVIALN